MVADADLQGFSSQLGESVVFNLCLFSMEEPEDNRDVSVPSSSLASTSQVAEEEIDGGEEEDNGYHHRQQQYQPPQRSSSLYRLNFSISNVASTDIRDDVWSCVVVLVTFWLFASMTLILGFYGSVNLQLGPNCSHLIEVNPFFVQSIKAQEIDESKPGSMLYGFDQPPPLDVKTTWSETHDAFVPINYHKEWIFFLNEGSKVDISYNIKSPISLPLSLVIAKGRESLVEWVEDPSYPNTTLFWSIIYGRGKITQNIFKSSTYYIAVGNLNSEEVEVDLRFTVEALVYDTTGAYYRCSPSNNLCSFKLSILRASAAVLTSMHREEGAPDSDWYIKLSYGPRWITYIVGSGAMTALILLAFRFCNIFYSSREVGTGFQAGEVGSERAPLLLHKDDDLSSWGSSYESCSHEEEDFEVWLAGSYFEGKPSNEGEDNKNPRGLCIICFDKPRDCFFLPCGHCAACFTCGTRIAEEAGTCPICRRKMKKVRKIFTV